MDKGLITNFLALALTIGGYFSPWFSQNLTAIGIFALSGSLTNWLALHMLFEKVPFIYGSGVIPLRFENIKHSIGRLVMDEFFGEERISHLLKHADSILEGIDYDKAFELVKKTVLESNIGGLIKVLGGEKTLDSHREKFKETMQAVIRDMMQDESLQKNILAGVRILVEERLNELTPNAVKKIVQNMIRSHLGWLVVWGGVFGGLIGFIFHFVWNRYM